VSFVLLCSFAGVVEPFLPSLEEPVVCELCVWELLCSICIAFFCLTTPTNSNTRESKKKRNE
jgi:hypothetical protein